MDLRQKYSRLVFIITAFVAFVFIIVFSTYPIWLDSDPLKSIELWRMSSKNKQVTIPLTSIFPVAKKYCAIGPYDTFLDSRFNKHLTSAQIKHIDAELRQRFGEGRGDNQFVLVGITDMSIRFIYFSVFFDKEDFDKEEHIRGVSNGEDCVGSTGQLNINYFESQFYLSLEVGN